MKKIKKYALYPLLILLIFVSLVLAIVHLPTTQDLIRTSVIAVLQNTYGVNVEMEEMSFSLFSGTVELKKMTLDLENDQSIVKMDSMGCNVSVTKVLTGTVEVESFGINGLEANVVQFADSSWNYNKVLEALFPVDTSASVEDTATGSLPVRLGTMMFDNVLLTYQSELTGDSIRLKLDHFESDFGGSGMVDSIKIRSMGLSGMDISAALTFPEVTDSIEEPVAEEQTSTSPLPVVVCEDLHFSGIQLRLSNQKDLTAKSSLSTFSLGHLEVDLNHRVFVMDSLELNRPDLVVEQMEQVFDALEQPKEENNAPEPQPIELPDMTLRLGEYNITNGHVSYITGKEQGSHLNDTLSVEDFYFIGHFIHLNKDSVGFELQELSASSNLYPAGLMVNGKGKLTRLETSFPELEFHTGRSFATTVFEGPGILGKTPDQEMFREDVARFTIWKSEIYPREMMRFLDLKDTAGTIPDALLDGIIDVRAKIVLDKEKIRCEELRVWEEDVFTSRTTGLFSDVYTPDKLKIKSLHNTLEIRKNGFALVNALSGGMAGFKDSLRINSVFSGDRNQLDFNTRLIADFNDVHLKGNVNVPKEQIEVSGNLKLHNYVGNELQASVPNKVDGTIQANVNGFDLEKGAFDYQIALNRFYWNEYTYQDFSTTGSLKDQHFTGETSVNDKNLKANIRLDITDVLATPHLKFNGAITKADLSELKLYNEIRDLNMRIQGDLSGSEVNNINGTCSVNDLNIHFKDTTFSTNLIALSVRSEDSSYALDLDSKPFSMHYKGNEPVLAFTDEISETMLSHVPDQKVTPDKVDLHGTGIMDVHIHEIGELLSVYVPDLTECKDIDFNLKYHGESGDIHGGISTKSITYSGMKLEAPDFALHCNMDTFGLDFHLDSVRYEEYLLPEVRLASRFGKDTIRSLVGIGNKGEAPELQLVTDVFHNASEQWLLSFLPNRQIVAKQNWNVNRNNYLELSEGPEGQGELNMKNGSSSVHAWVRKGPGNSHDVHLALTGIKIHPILEALHYNDIAGVLNLQVGATDIFGDLRLKADAYLDNLSYEKTEYCDAHIGISQPQKATYHVELEAKGPSVDVMNETDYNVEQARFKSILEVNKLDLKELGPFVAEYADSLTGNLVGAVKVNGTAEHPRMNGLLKLNDLNVKVLPTNTAYTMNMGLVKLKDNEMVLNRFRLTDEWGKTANIKGGCDFKNTDSIHYKFNVDLDHFTVLNTKGEDPEEEYFGLLKSTSSIKIQDDANGKLLIDGVLGVDEESALQMRYLDTRDYNRHEGLLRFIDKDTVHLAAQRKQHQQLSVPEQTMEINTRIEVSPKATMRLIMDPEAGDYLLISGTANLFFRTEKNGLMTLNGTYEVNDGLYRLSFYSLVQKKFSIVPGSTLKWTGDPYNPYADITCAYGLKTSPKPLLAGADNVSNSRLPFNVLLRIQDKVLQPSIDYGIELDENASSSNRTAIETALALLDRDKDEEIKQVVSLLTLSKFSATQSGQDDGSGGLNASAYKSVSDMLSNQLNSLSQKYIKDFNVNMDVELTDNNNAASTANATDPAHQPSAQVSLNFQKGFFDNKIVVAAGGDYADPNASPTRSTDLSTDINVTYRLTPDGRLNLSVYRKGSYEGEIEGDVIKTGVTLVFLKNFDTFKELLTNQKADKNEQKEEADKKNSDDDDE